MSRAPRRKRRTSRAGAVVRPPASRSPSPAEALSRRRFMALIAAGSAASLLAPARGIEAAAAPVSNPALLAPTAKMRKEIEKLKKSTADQLKVIRDYELPPGSVMAFEFRALGRRKK